MSDESIRDVLRDIRRELQQIKQRQNTMGTCCVTRPDGTPIPPVPYYGYDLPPRLPLSEEGGEYCQRVQAALETIVSFWNQVHEYAELWLPAGAQAFLSFASGLVDLPQSVKSRLVISIAAEIAQYFINNEGAIGVISSYDLCRAARQYVQSAVAGANDPPDEILDALAAVQRPLFALFWRLTGGLTAILDDPDFSPDLSLYNPACCLLDRATVKWEPRYVGAGCAGYTDGFHGVDWYGTSILDYESGEDVTALYPRTLYGVNGLVAFRRANYMNMWFYFPGYPGQLPDRIYLVDDLSTATVCAMFQGTISPDVLTLNDTAYQVGESGSEYIVIRAATIGDGRDWYIQRDSYPAGGTDTI